MSLLQESNYLAPPQTAPLRKGRCPAEGYWRSSGIAFQQFGRIALGDPLFFEAFSLAKGRSIVSLNNLLNIFLIMKFFLKNINQGDIIEFGSYRGGSAVFMAFIAKKLFPDIKIYALDTFEGMPKTDKSIDLHNEGDFADTSFQELQDYKKKLGLDNLILVKGLFEDTAPDVLKKVNGISLAHIDCDIYSAVCFSYAAIREVMVNSGYIIFDDPLAVNCLGAMEALEDLVYGQDRLYSEQVFPHFVFRSR